MQSHPAFPKISTTTESKEHPLGSLVDSLTQIVGRSEDDFLHLGTNLQQVQLMSSSQRQKIAEAMSLFKADDDCGILRQISNYVQQSQQETQDAQERASVLCANLTAMMKLMDSIAQKCHSLERTGLFLHVIGINTGIECSRHLQVEAMFKVVSKDTIMLANQIRQATIDLLEQIDQAKAEQKKTLADAQQSIDSLKSLAEQSNKTTQKALSKVAELVDYSVTMVNEAEQMALNITAEINHVVMGIQFHDNLRQRIEHVSEALLETEIISDNSAQETICSSSLSIELQRAQLDNLSGELKTLYATQSSALDRIIEAVSGLETKLASMAKEQEQDPAEDNPVAVLLSGISALENLHHDSQDLGQGIEASAERAEQIATKMQVATRTTFAIANDVKINALNAIIKAAKFGRAGKSLEVLAQGMVSVAKETRELVKVFNELLGQLSELSQTDTNKISGQDQLSSIENFDSAQLQQLFHSFRTEVQSSKTDCSTLAESLKREHQRLEFIANLRQAIEQHADQLGRYAESIAPEDDQLLATMRAKFGKQYEERYTMNEERAIHRQTLLLAADSAAPATESTAEKGDDCLWFSESAGSAPSQPATDIDLWEDPPEAAPEPSIELFDDPAPSAADESSGEIELWEQPTKPPDEAEASMKTTQANDELENDQNKKEDFGANVELF